MVESSGKGLSGPGQEPVVQRKVCNHPYLRTRGRDGEYCFSGVNVSVSDEGRGDQVVVGSGRGRGSRGEMTGM